MMGDSKISFWREAFPQLKIALRAKALWIVGLALILTAIQFFFVGSLPPDLTVQLKTNPNLIKEHPEYIHLLLSACILQLLILTVATYVFTLFYLQLAAKSAPPQITFVGYFYWLWKAFQKGLLLFAGMLVPLIVMGIVMASFHFLALSKTPNFTAIAIGSVGSIGWLLYLTYRLYIVTPLAILRKKPVLKGSWRLTKGKCLRIFGGQIILLIMTGWGFIVLLIIVNLYAYSVNSTPTAVVLIKDLIRCSMSSVFVMMGAVYQCTILRIAMREAQENLQVTNI